MSSSPSWEVAAVANEAPDLIIGWAAYHLALGARGIHLFLERPEPRLLEVLGGHARIAVTVTDAAFWRRELGEMPRRIGMRQRYVLQHILDTSRADWVFHIDVDEFLAGQGTIEAALSAQPAYVDYAVVDTAERVYLGPPDPEDVYYGAFRRRHGETDQVAANLADGSAALMLDQGMTAYAAGKSAFRTGRALVAGVHFPRPQVPSREGYLAGFELLHFDGFTPAHWVAKRQRVLRYQPERMQNDAPFRRMQLTEIQRRHPDTDALRDLYLELKQLSPARAQALDALGVLVKARFDPRPQIAEVFPGLTCQFSEADIDAYDLAR